MPKCNYQLSKAKRLADRRHEARVDDLSTLGVNQVLVNPEAKAHVRVEHEVDDGTTRDVGVLISKAIGEFAEHNTVDRINEQLLNSSRSANWKSDEHVMKAK